MRDDLYCEVQQFYARQMWLLDNGDADSWADTFTEDGTFVERGRYEPLTGRRDIAAAARRRVDAVTGDGLVRRHWLGMLRVEDGADGTVRTRYRAVALSTPYGGGPATLYASTTAEDVLLRDRDDLRVRERHVTHDG
ncbi:nuclear transport factor 2 family protein [Saccharomonospora saliphila]|uniref:nuclear transport factor 2 family protein n=1 Tax=Saccharomonospora saliphila TaxID=369829 RepID=UPI000370E5F1|nr:nuclear transport factor 2 family protein [Saccharomonospora saliphila]